jgi:hypothetical protein
LVATVACDPEITWTLLEAHLLEVPQQRRDVGARRRSGSENNVSPASRPSEPPAREWSFVGMSFVRHHCTLRDDSGPHNVV